MNRTLVLPAALGLLVPVLAGCGGSDSGSGDGDTIVVGTTDRFTATEDAPAPLDPAYAYDVGTWNVLRQTVQTLMIMPKGDGGPVPEAARNCAFTDSGNERYACTLRDDLKFADGDPVTAQDVKFSIDRARSLKGDSGVFALLSTIDTVETQGNHEVIFHLDTADATFPYKLSTPVAGIVNPDDYAADRLREGFQVDGSGPYTLRAEVRGDEMVDAVFTRNPHYRGSLKVRNDTAELRSFDSSDSMGDALDTGDIDVMTRTMSPEQIDRLDSDTDGDSDVSLVELAGLEIRYLGFDTEAPSVESRAVRAAMAQVVNRGELVSTVYGSQAEPLYSMVPAGVTGHANSFFNTYGDPDTAKAESLLTDAGITTPVKLTLHYTTDHYGPATQREFEVLRKQLDDTGLFDVDIEGHPWDTFRQAEQKGAYDVYGMGWFPDYPDAENFLTPFLDKDNTIGSPYVNSEIRDTLIPKSRQESDRFAAADTLTKIQDIVAEDVPLLPLWQGKQYVAARDEITGTAYALNSSSTLQLWELGRGVSD